MPHHVGCATVGLIEFGPSQKKIAQEYYPRRQSVKTIACPQCAAGPKLDVQRGESAEAKRLSHCGRPLRYIRAVGVEHGDSKAIHSERHAASVRSLAIRVPEVPSHAEMVTVIIEAHAGRRLLQRAQRDQKFKFQRLLLLANRLHLPDPTEEWIAGIIDSKCQAEIAAMAWARAIQRSRKSETISGLPIQTYSRIRNDCSRSS